jgi:hypothetical protein
MPSYHRQLFIPSSAKAHILKADVSEASNLILFNKVEPSTNGHFEKYKEGCSNLTSLS